MIIIIDDNSVEELWKEFEDVTMDENMCIINDWSIWRKGTSREEIWGWFNHNHSKGIHWLMNEYEG